MAVWNQDDDYRVTVECNGSSGLQDLFVDFDQWVLNFQGKCNLRRLHYEKTDSRKDQETASPGLYHMYVTSKSTNTNEKSERPSEGQLTQRKVAQKNTGAVKKSKLKGAQLAPVPSGLEAASVSVQPQKTFVARAVPGEGDGSTEKPAPRPVELPQGQLEKISPVHEDEEGWIEVKKKDAPRRSTNKNSSIIHGTAVVGVTGLQPAERFRYMHLFYVCKGTTAEQVQAHLDSICKGAVCTVETLNARGEYASFKLAVPDRHVAQVAASENWAAGICVKPWRQNFRRKIVENEN
ncbi:unnamed protein product [Plutella xylostella]|uniref:(diamondback moth) hypothetical protein n=1 Tax=Plutella xylostella TaxID=51655 RepID=A0A8S4G2I8_PLUXY|nr:unnamed protein product [Plutella xylostella]